MFPQVTAMGSAQRGTIAGKLKGQILAVTPMGTLYEMISKSLATSMSVWPLSWLGMLQANSTTSKQSKENINPWLFYFYILPQHDKTWFIHFWGQYQYELTRKPIGEVYFNLICYFEKSSTPKLQFFRNTRKVIFNSLGRLSKLSGAKMGAALRRK